MKTLFLIPARGGSKGIPNKNIKLLNGKPLINYSIEYARQFSLDKNICLSTDSEKIAKVAQTINLAVPFLRPDELATDTSSSFGVMHHALDFYKSIGHEFDSLVLLQATSPLRAKNHYIEMARLMDEQTDAVVSVNLEDKNPYYNLFEENAEGFLKISKGEGSYTRRQDCPSVFSFNGNIYIFNVKALMNAKAFGDLKNIKKYEMASKYKIDLDTTQDWEYCEFIFSKF